MLCSERDKRWSFAAGGDGCQRRQSARCLDGDVRLTRPTRQPMIFQYSGVDIQDHVGTLETAVGNIFDNGSRSQYAVMLFFEPPLWKNRRIMLDSTPDDRTRGYLGNSQNSVSELSGD